MFSITSSYANFSLYWGRGYFLQLSFGLLDEVNWAENVAGIVGSSKQELLSSGERKVERISIFFIMHLYDRIQKWVIFVTFSDLIKKIFNDWHIFSNFVYQWNKLSWSSQLLHWFLCVGGTFSTVLNFAISKWNLVYFRKVESGQNKKIS